MIDQDKKKRRNSYLIFHNSIFAQFFAKEENDLFVTSLEETYEFPNKAHDYACFSWTDDGCLGYKIDTLEGTCTFLELHILWIWSSLGICCSLRISNTLYISVFICLIPSQYGFTPFQHDFWPIFMSRNPVFCHVVRFFKNYMI